MSRTSHLRLPLPDRLGCWLRAVATYDVIPAFSAKVRRRLYNPLGILLLAALTALLCGLFLHPRGFVLLGGASVGGCSTTGPWRAGTRSSP